MSSFNIDASAGQACEGILGGGAISGFLRFMLSPLDARVLRAVDPWRERTAARVAKLAGCSEDVGRSSLRRLRGWMLIEPDGSRPTGWLRTRHGDLMLGHQP